MVSLFGMIAVKVEGSSMTPAYKNGDFVLVRKTKKAEIGQVVICQRPDRPDLLIMKRVQSLTENGYWLKGDNQEYSDDSRVFGEVEKNLIIGKVIFKYWPLFTN